eukprot:5915429-Karenia_brevis.AAC.1
MTFDLAVSRCLATAHHLQSSSRYHPECNSPKPSWSDGTLQPDAPSGGTEAVFPQLPPAELVSPVAHSPPTSDLGLHNEGLEDVAG